MKSTLILLLLVSVAVTVSVARRRPALGELWKVSSLSSKRTIFNRANRSQLKWRNGPIKFEAMTSS